LRWRHYRVWEVALLAGSALLGNVAFRGTMDWLLLMLTLGVPHLKELLAQAARSRPRRRPVLWLLWLDRKLKQMLNSPSFRFQPFWPAAALAVLLTISVIPPLSRNMPRQNAAGWPVAALDHIEKTGLVGRFFSPPDYGAYIGWRLRHRAKVYTDTRGFYFPPRLLADSHYLPQLGPDWRRRLDRVLDDYGTDFFLLETFGERGKLWHFLKDRVGVPLYVDEQAVLLSAAQVRRGINEVEQNARAAR
jgi:hypothetical protein